MGEEMRLGIHGLGRVLFGFARIARSLSACRLLQVGITDVFTVPGDFNLTLFNHLIAEPGLTNIGCCIVGGHNYNDYGTNRILHHTIGLPDFTQELRSFLLSIPLLPPFWPPRLHQE
ncbi:unnamed protein product [Linum trigynum]|uniref:pyruvate decarboxylase n=1 Tax=Linum trigynum TaxID=586398 RepID=A0AAV2FVF1_9ROSI